MTSKIIGDVIIEKRTLVEHLPVGITSSQDKSMQLQLHSYETLLEI